jgi:ATP/maltotriose-dependent transcriptional regulator MalT
VVVQAKAPQRTQPKIIERPRLTRQLDKCGARTILLVAPAGYGKTTLARQWLADKPHAWCGLTPASRDVAALALGIAGAVRSIVPDAGARMQTRLGLSAGPMEEIAIFVEMLAADLADWPADAWLAIDDYHAIAGVTDCETFIEGLLNSTDVRLLATSRLRPNWATSRSRVYGLHYELERETLAMTDEEAAEVVADAKALELAKGWPAVVGLAASLEQIEPGTELADSAALHSYLTEELLKNAPTKTQQGLFRLSLCPDLRLDQTRAVLGGRRVASLVEQSTRLGLVSVRDGVVVMHPLVRQCVWDWYRARNVNWVADTNHVARRLIEQGLWDAAFALIQKVGGPLLLEELLQRGLMPMLRAGRHSTVASWVEQARNTPLARSPWVLLAEAEVASRRGDQHQAQALSVQAARASESDNLSVRAWILAGRSAHLLDHYSEANEYHRRAEAMATTDKERYDALWGQIVASWQCDPGRASRLVAALTDLADESIDSQLRLFSVTFQTGLQRGRVADLEDRVREALILAPRAANPLVASSFLVISSRWFCTTGRYEEALRVVDDTVALAEQHRLSFVLPSALTARAGRSWDSENGVRR